MQYNGFYSNYKYSLLIIIITGIGVVTTQAPGHVQELPGVRVTVHLCRGGPNYGPQAVGTVLDSINRATPMITGNYS